MNDERTPEEIERLAGETAHRLLNTPKKPKPPKPAEESNAEGADRRVPDIDAGTKLR